jgi:hypothetical protein
MVIDREGVMGMGRIAVLGAAVTTVRRPLTAVSPV